MAGRVSGRVVLVTGGAQGLGEGIAARLVEEGGRVVITDLNASTGEATAGRLGCRFLQQDVSDEPSWQQVLGNIEEVEGSLHAIVNNAGTEGSPYAPKDPEGAPLEDWERIFSVNARSVFLGCKYAIPLLRQSGGGAIVNFSSVAALAAVPFIAAYGASKAAVQQYSRSVALHCARSGSGVRCNSVHPGQIRTPMLDGLIQRIANEQGVEPDAVAQQLLANIPMGQFQEPRDVANLVLFLVSDEARFITGQAIAVDGGFTLFG